MKKVTFLICMMLTFAGADKIDRGVIVDDYPDSFADAQIIHLGERVTGKLETNKDNDYFKFTLDKENGIIIDAQSLTDWHYPYLVVYDSDKKELQKEMIGSAGKEHLAYNLSSGTYYIRIYQYNGELLSYTFDLKENGSDSIKTSLHPATVAYCRSHPKECGIYIKDKLSVYDINSIKDTDWHLLGTTGYTSVNILKNVKYAAIFQNGEWKFYSPDEVVREQMKGAGYKIFNAIPYNSGVWIKK